MSTYETTYIDGIEVRVKKPGAGETALITDYGTLDDYLALFQKHYDEDRAAFFDSTANDEDLPDKIKRWAATSRTYLGLARTLSNVYGESDKYYQISLEIADRVMKDSGLRLLNLDQHYELMKKDHPEKTKKLGRLSKEITEGMNFFSRAMATQSILIRRVNAITGGPAGIEMEMEKKAGERMEALEAMVPRGHMYLPARPFPPVEIPEGYRVPCYPDPYVRVKELPVKDLIYDLDHDEFLVRPGYVSEDGLIDDQSVVWNWEERLVTMKFRGGEPIVWPFWKARDASDVPKGWSARYLRRRYLDWLDSIQWGILKRK